MKKIAIIAFNEFTDIDLWLMWDLLKRARTQAWEVKILGTEKSHTSQTGISVQMHGHVTEANSADVVLFISGPGTRKLNTDASYLSLFQLNPSKQLIGSMCSGALLLAALGIIKPGDEATTYPTAKNELEKFGVTVVEKPFINKGNVATAAGCLAAQELVGWVIENLADRALRTTIINSIQPVGAGLSFTNASLGNLYSTT